MHVRHVGRTSRLAWASQSWRGDRYGRDIIVAGLNQVPGFRCPLPGGAFYAFPNVTATGMSSRELADFLLNEAGVAGLNGGSFGQHGDGYIRFSGLRNTTAATILIWRSDNSEAPPMIASATPA